MSPDSHRHPITPYQSPDDSSAEDRHHRRRCWIEVAAFAFGCAALLHFTALISYTPDDLPGWVPFQASPREAGAAYEVSNFTGISGVFVAAASFFTVGAAAFLVSPLLVWLGIALLWRPQVFTSRLAPSLVVFLGAAACLAELQTFLFQSWVDSLELPASKGGLVGLVAGNLVLDRTLGLVGGVLSASLAMAVSFAYIAGFHPFDINTYLRRRLTESNRKRKVVRTATRPRTAPSPAPANPGSPGFAPHQSAVHAAHQAGVLDPQEDYPAAVGHPILDAEVDIMPREEPPVFVTSPQHEPSQAASPPEPPGAPSEIHHSEPAPFEQPSPVPPFASPSPAPRETTSSTPHFAEPDPVEAPEEGPILVARGAGRNGPPSQETLPAPVEEEPTPLTPAHPAPRIIDTNKERLPKSERPSGFDPAAMGFRAHRGQFGDYDLPTLNYLDDEDDDTTPLTDQAELLETQRVIIDTLATFGVNVTPGDITRGPTITRYEIYPSKGLRVKQITTLEADIARATRAECINILAPIPGRDTVGVEIANNRKVVVPLRKLLEQPTFLSGKAQIPIALGKDVYGKAIVADLAAMPHLLVAGATGSGKSVCINSVIASLLFRFSPEDLRIIMIDPKVVEMQVYQSLPHLAVPVVTHPKKVLTALQWCINEMERRYELFARHGVRKLEEYNRVMARLAPGEVVERAPGASQLQFDLEIDADAPEAAGAPTASEDPNFLPFIVIIIDELADLMQTAPAEVETSINRLCQKARAAGIHLIVATQSPRVDVVTGLIKANIPARIAFQVASSMDSRVILDKSGAEKLLGKGDMLYQPPDSPVVTRTQGAFVTDEEVKRIVDHCSSQAEPLFEPHILDKADGDSEGEEPDLSAADEETLQKCVEVILAERKASTSFLQRRLRLGYNRAARMMDILEERGVVGPVDGAKPRAILVDEPAADPGLES